MWSFRVILLTFAALVFFGATLKSGIFSVSGFFFGILFCILLYGAHIYYKEDNIRDKKMTIDKKIDANKKTTEQSVAEKYISQEGNKKGVKIMLLVTFFGTILSFFLGIMLNIPELISISWFFLFLFCGSIALGIFIYTGFFVID